MHRGSWLCRATLAAAVAVCPVLLRAAIPPEPIEELLPRAALIVVAEVATVVSTAPYAPPPRQPAGWVGGPQGLPRQVVVLKVERVLRGQLTAEEQARGVTVTKPPGEYQLGVSNRGPFLLERKGDTWVILGRYGPDNYRVEHVEQALKQQR